MNTAQAVNTILALREAAQQALEALEESGQPEASYQTYLRRKSALEALRAALEAPEITSKGKFVWVPTELTNEMMTVYQTAFVSQDRFDVHKVWAKMLDAAPKVEPLTDEDILRIGERIDVSDR